MLNSNYFQSNYADNMTIVSAANVFNVEKDIKNRYAKSRGRERETEINIYV
jgi:hypothetical protein